MILRRLLAACVLATTIFPGCAQTPPDEPTVFLDRESRPPPNRILPAQMVRISGMVSPLAADQITGAWRTGTCGLVLSGDALEGEAIASGDCPHGLENAARWVIEPEHRARLALLDAAGNELWAGVYTRADRLAGTAAHSGPLEFTR